MKAFATHSDLCAFLDHPRVVGPFGYLWAHRGRILRLHLSRSFVRKWRKRSKPLSRAAWIERYGGQALLNAEGFDVVPCLACDDSICHGWRVTLKGSGR